MYHLHQLFEITFFSVCEVFCFVSVYKCEIKSCFPQETALSRVHALYFFVSSTFQQICEVPTNETKARGYMTKKKKKKPLNPPYIPILLLHFSKMQNRIKDTWKLGKH